jgi:hypothetical protein
MSHFTVAVITNGQPSYADIEKALAPYQENNMGDCPKEFLAFRSLSAEYKDEYENGTTERVRLADGTLVYPWSDCLYTEVTKDAYEKAKADGKLTRYTGFKEEKWFVKKDLEKIGAVLVEIPWKEVYSTLEEYLEDYHDAKKDEETHDYGYWENPNAKWDWWQIGGRWCGKLMVAADCNNCGYGELSWGCGNENPYTVEAGDYKKVDSARIKDLVFLEERKAYDKAKRFWEMHIEGRLPETDEEAEELKFAFYKPEYYEKTYGTKETYAECESTFHTYAVIDKNGCWHSKGEMGWFGVSLSDENQEVNFIRKYKETVFNNAEDDDYITIVDCHI